MNILNNRRKKVRLKQKQQIRLIIWYKKYVPDIKILDLKARFIKDKLIFKSTKSSKPSRTPAYRYIEYMFRPNAKDPLYAEITLIPYSPIENIEVNIVQDVI